MKVGVDQGRDRRLSEGPGSSMAYTSSWRMLQLLFRLQSRTHWLETRSNWCPMISRVPEEVVGLREMEPRMRCAALVLSRDVFFIRYRQRIERGEDQALR